MRQFLPNWSEARAGSRPIWTRIRFGKEGLPLSRAPPQLNALALYRFHSTGQKMRRAASVRRVRRQKSGGLDGYLGTWDVDSADAAVCARLRRFVFGYACEKAGRRYAYSGLLDLPGVRYLGQSVVFVPAGALGPLRTYLGHEGIDHVVMHASVGAILTS